MPLTLFCSFLLVLQKSKTVLLAQSVRVRSAEIRQNLECSEVPLEPNEVLQVGMLWEESLWETTASHVLTGVSFGSCFIITPKKRQSMSCRSHKSSCQLWVLIPVGTDSCFGNLPATMKLCTGTRYLPFWNFICFLIANFKCFVNAET